MKKIFYFILLVFILPLVAFSQSRDSTNFKCGLSEKLNNKARLQSNTLITLDSSIKIRIPVVFHIYHTGEVIGNGFNFSEEVIKTVIYDLNQLYRGKGIYSETFDSNIEFYLLSDTLNCPASQVHSNGIKRANLANLPSNLYQYYLQVGINNDNKAIFDKELSQLSANPISLKCLNIRLIPNYNGKTVGFVTTGQFEDVMLQSSLVFSTSNVIAHEIGHVLGLSHTFSGDTENCFDGDGISDTDIHQKSDLFDPDDINTCTGRIKGKIIYNVMSYGIQRTNFTRMQITRMREIINLFLPNSIQPAQNVFRNQAIKGSPFAACSFTSDQASASFKYAFEFNLGNINYYNLFEKSLSYLDLSCALKTELSAGEKISFVFRDDNLSNIHFKIYIDFNNDSDFNDGSEEVFTGQTNGASLIRGNFIIPSNAINYTWLRLRIVRSSTSSFNSCNSSGVGTASDFSIKILPNCTSPNPPTVTNKTITYGQNTSLSSLGCIGNTRWYSKGELLSTGDTYSTSTLFEDTYFQATCQVNDCESLATNIKVCVQNELSVGNLSTLDYCVNGIINIPINTNLPNDNIYTLYLRKGQTIINSKYVRNTSTNSINIPRQYSSYTGAKLQYIEGGGYELQIESQDLYNNRRWMSPLIPINIGVIESYNHRIVDNPDDIYDINTNFLNNSDFLCNNTTKTIFAQVVNIDGKSLSKSNLRFNWKKDGVSIGKTTTNHVNVNQTGNYTFEVSQAGCIGVSNSYSLYGGSYTFNKPRVIGTEYACLGVSKEIVSDYQSTSATYQWKKNGINIEGATENKLIVQQSGNYNVEVNETGCNIYIGKDNQIQFSEGLPANISSSDSDSTFCFTTYGPYTYSNSIRLQDSFESGSSIANEYEYQWQKDGITIPNETKNYIDIAYKNSFNNGTGVYRLLKTQGNCASLSNTITLTESSTYPKPVISVNPSSTTLCDGFISLEVSPLKIGGIFFKDTLSISSGYYYLNVTESGTYKYVVGNDITCKNESDPISISIGSEFVPKIDYLDPMKKNLCGQNDYLVLSFRNNSSNFGYQWLKGGVEIPNSTSSNIFIDTPGTYTLRVSNGQCTSISNEINIKNNNSDIKIKTLDNNLGCTNRVSKITLTGTPNNSSAENIVWKFNGNILSQEKARSLYTDRQGSYSLEYSNNGCTITTSPLIISSNLTPKPTTLPVTINGGEIATLQSLGCTGTVFWYNSIMNGDILGVGNTFITPNINTSTYYFASCTVNGCNSSRTPTLVTVNPCLTLYSIVSGNWNTTTTWSCGRTPTITDDVTISAGHTVTIPAGQTGFVNNMINNGTIQNNGSLKFKTQ